jgi:hypothetical protein
MKERCSMRTTMRTLALIASIAFLAASARAQDIGTVTNKDDSTSTTERDSTHGTYGLKTTIRDSQGRVIKEEWKGSTRENGQRDTLEKKKTTYYPDGKVVTRKTTYNPSAKGGEAVKKASETTTRDALGGSVTVDTTKDDDERDDEPAEATDGDGTTSATERDTRYGNDGLKTTTKDAKGRIVKEEWTGNAKKNGKRDVLEKTWTIYHADGRVLTSKTTYNPAADGGEPVQAASRMTTRDALGGVTFDSTMKYDAKGKTAEGTVIERDPETGKTMTHRFNPSKQGWEDDKPAKEPAETAPSPTRESELKKGDSKNGAPGTDDPKNVWNREIGRATLSRPRPAPFAILIPSDARAGETVSVSVTTEPRSFERIPGLRVVPGLLSLPKDEAGRPSLQRVGLDAGGGMQSADGPAAVLVPADASRLVVRVLPPGESASVEIRREIALSREVAPRSALSGEPRGYRTPAVCRRGSVQAIWGPLGGDATKTRVDVDGQPTRIVAETPRAVYWCLPERAAAGPHRVVLRENGGSFAFEILVMELDMTADRLQLQRGQSTRYHVRLNLGSAPETGWRSAPVPPDLVDLAALEKDAPDLRRPAPGEPGKVLLVLTNASPRTIAVPDMRGNERSFELGPQDFAGGVFTHDGDIRSVASGGFVINGLAVAAVAPAPGVPLTEAQDPNVSDTYEARRIRVAINRLDEARRNYHRTMDKTESAFMKGRKTAPRAVDDKYSDAQLASHRQWINQVDVWAKYDGNKTEENKKAYDEGEKKQKELDEAAAEAKQKVIDGMTKEARTAYYDAEDAERAAGQELTAAEKEMAAATAR